MGVRLADCRRYSVNGFNGGLNQLLNGYNIRDNELIEAENVEFSTPGTIRAKKGSAVYADHQVINRRIAGGIRYCKKDGTRQVVVANSTGALFADDDAGTFSSLSETIVLSDNGFVKMAQWGDTLLAVSNQDNMHAYNDGESTEVIEPSADDNGIGHNWLLVSDDNVLTTGNLDDTKYYAYRFTFEQFHGDDFLCETTPMISVEYIHGSAEGGRGARRKTYNYRQWYDGGRKTINLIKNPYFYPSDETWLSKYKNINIYRTDGVGSGEIPDSTKEEYGFFLLATISVADYIAASANEIIFTDSGNVPVQYDKMIRYDIMRKMPRGSCINVHKNRILLGNVKTRDIVTDEITHYPYRVYLSEYLEPCAFRSTGWFDVQKNDGESITAMVSFKNQFDVVFKENSMWALIGGDEEPIPGVPLLKLDCIDSTVGCIAPNSVCFIEGVLVWWSNKGLYYYDGSGPPQPFYGERIKTAMDNVRESQKQNVAIGYHSKKRKMFIALSDKTSSNSLNTFIYTYDFYSGCWASTTATLGIGLFIQKQRGDEANSLLGCVEEDVLIILVSQVSIYNMESRDSCGDWDYNALAYTVTSWKARTKFFDCGHSEIDKKFIAVLVQCSTIEALTLDVACDRRIDTSVSGGGFTIPLISKQNDLIWEDDGDAGIDHVWESDANSATNWQWAGPTYGEQLIYLNDKMWGKRISLIPSGNSGTFPPEIQAITIFWVPKQEVRS